MLALERHTLAIWQPQQEYFSAASLSVSKALRVELGCFIELFFSVHGWSFKVIQHRDISLSG
jgi:hypothetical protein